MIDNLLGGCNEATRGAEGFAKSSHLDIDLVGAVELGGEACASGSTDSVGVSFVEEEPRAELIFELDDF